MFLSKIEISFWRHKSKRAGMAQLYCRIHVGGQKADIGSTGITIDYNHWDADARRVVDDDPEAVFKNEQLDILRNQLRAIFNDLFRRREKITGTKIKRLFLGHSGSVTLLTAFDLYLEDCRTGLALVRYLTDSTITVYTNVQKKLLAFLESRRATDLLVEDFDLKWVKSYRNWLKQAPLERPNRGVDRIGYTDSYTIKHIHGLRNVMVWAKINKLVPTNPLEGYRVKGAKFDDPDFLTPDEFNRLRRHRFENPHMQQVADVFVILCRTGFHYGDLVDLANKHASTLQKGIDGQMWIIKKRIKTDIPTRLPLFDEVAEIVDKYGGWDKLPLLHSSAFNRWLKLIAGEMKFHPNLSSKAGRKTFTDWCFNTLGLSTDAILPMLGRTSAGGLKVYGRPDERRIAAELRNSEERQKQKNASSPSPIQKLSRAFVKFFKLGHNS